MAVIVISWGYEQRLLTKVVSCLLWHLTAVFSGSHAECTYSPFTTQDCSVCLVLRHAYMSLNCTLLTYASLMIANSFGTQICFHSFSMPSN